MADVVMSAIAMVSLKAPSMLVFEKRRYDENINVFLFRVLSVPSDMQMRTILDPLEPDLMRAMFKRRFSTTATRESAGTVRLHKGCYLCRWRARDISRRKRFIASLGYKKEQQDRRDTYHHQMFCGLTYAHS